MVRGREGYNLKGVLAHSVAHGELTDPHVLQMKLVDCDIDQADKDVHHLHH